MDKVHLNVKGFSDIEEDFGFKPYYFDQMERKDLLLQGFSLNVQDLLLLCWLSVGSWVDKNDCTKCSCRFSCLLCFVCVLWTCQCVSVCVCVLISRLRVTSMIQKIEIPYNIAPV